MINVISLGCGVQSSTMLFMAARGEITPMPDAAIFADTGEEPESVYRWLRYLEAQDFDFPIMVRSKGNLGQDNLKYFKSRKSGKVYSKSLIPLFMKNEDGSKGILPRKCTRDYKIHVVQRTIRELMGLKRIPSITKRGDEPVLVTSWIGISIDEADRMKPSNLDWIVNRWPLIELEMSRQDCKNWMRDHGYPEPPRSACRQCPYHSDVEWLRLKNDEPDEFSKAVQWEREYQSVIENHCEVTKGTPFLHSSLVPLDQVVFDPNKGRDKFSNECEGMCGV